MLEHAENGVKPKPRLVNRGFLGSSCWAQGGSGGRNIQRHLVRETGSAVSSKTCYDERVGILKHLAPGSALEKTQQALSKQGILHTTLGPWS